MIKHWVALCAAMLVTGAVQAQSPETMPPDDGSQPATAASVAAADRVDLEDIRSFVRVYNTVKASYVDEVSDQRLMQAAIHGLLSQLDPHSALLDRQELRALSEDASGAYAGIGVRIAPINGRITVIAPLDGTPAARAGIRSGDAIVGINGTPVTEANLDQMIDALRGKVGSQVTLAILHDKATVPEEMQLTRERIQLRSVRSRLLQPGFAWLRISEFQAATARQLRAAIDKLENEGPLAGVVLDLRSNPGGLVEAAVNVGDLFLDHGTIVSMRGRLVQANLAYTAAPGDVLAGAPMVVLINRGTASAAEIVAGALKDNQRAIIMGQRSFGKGTVQSVLPLDERYAVKLTTARYYTPDGTSIQAEGIVPDITLGDFSVSRRDGPPTPILSEADLPHHLANPDGGGSAPPQAGNALVAEDYALSEALHVLQAMALARDTGEDGKP